MQARNGVVRLPIAGLRPRWLLSRGLCQYRCEDFTHVPRARRAAALALQLPQWSPFDNSQHHVVWSGGLAMVWFWDAGLLAGQPESGESGPADAALAPETLFRPRHRDGLCIQRCHEGHELQYWQDGVLRGSVWSLEAPSVERIHWFVDRQGAHGARDALIDGLQHSDTLLESAWHQGIDPGVWLRRNEWPLAGGLILLLLAVLTWQEARLLRLDWAATEAEQDFAELDDAVSPLLAARDSYRRLRRLNQRLTQLLAQPSQARLMGLVDQALPDDSARFSLWRYQQGALELVLRDAGADPVQYVRSLERQAGLRDVRIGQSRNADEVVLNMQVVSQ